ncbi:grpE protein homolog, mitochondrial [Neocloeon triangulifer]|uniref:grpE protein homolog, mitochondrial n=1 Tax=Neocloeon triangulifer TaxID=2078957 RepID=UPI00286EC2F8|nr:grpE protein homolog, mitochondrial [Neocloeon triangulifer]
MRGVRSIFGIGSKLGGVNSGVVVTLPRSTIRLSQGSHFYRTVAGGPRSLKFSSSVLVEKSRWLCTSAEKQAAQELTAEQIELKKLNEELEEERKKSAELQDKYMRALAENQNTLNRMRKQVDDAKIYGVQNLVKDLLEFSDVLQTALESTPKDQVTESNIHLKNLHIGLTMVSSSLQKVFKKYGVQVIDPLGEKFNPNLHEALFQQEVENKEAGTVVAVSKIGYKLSDRVIRPALVGVAK